MRHEAWELILILSSALVIPLIAAAKWPRWWWLIGLIVGCCFPTYMAVAGIVTQSNLWPIGIVIGGVLTMPPAFLGAGVGYIIGQRLRRPPPPDAPGPAGGGLATRVV